MFSFIVLFHTGISCLPAKRLLIVWLFSCQDGRHPALQRNHEAEDGAAETRLNPRWIKKQSQSRGAVSVTSSHPADIGVWMGLNVLSLKGRQPTIAVCFSDERTFLWWGLKGIICLWFKTMTQMTSPLQTVLTYSDFITSQGFFLIPLEGW